MLKSLFLFIKYFIIIILACLPTRLGKQHLSCKLAVGVIVVHVLVVMFGQKTDIEGKVTSCATVNNVILCVNAAAALCISAPTQEMIASVPAPSSSSFFKIILLIMSGVMSQALE